MDMATAAKTGSSALLVVDSVWSVLCSVGRRILHHHFFPSTHLYDSMYLLLYTMALTFSTVPSVEFYNVYIYTVFFSYGPAVRDLSLHTFPPECIAGIDNIYERYDTVLHLWRYCKEGHDLVSRGIQRIPHSLLYSTTSCTQDKLYLSGSSSAVSISRVNEVS
jgi:hypothetical protein